MAEDKPVNPRPVKGASTINDPLPEFRRESMYKAPKTEEEAWLKQLSSTALAGKGNNIAGSNFFVDKSARQLFTPVDLAKGIPDKWEREKFINDHGTKMVQLLDPNKYGVRFNNEIADYAVYKQKRYDTQVKKFLDELDENQGFLAAATNTAGKLIGKTALAVGSLIPTVYGIGSALFNWDSKKIFNNGLFDAWETMDQGLDKHLAVYGGSEYHEGDKNFFSRFMTNPMKSINNDVAPAVSFVAGAVLTELAATALAPVTGGTLLMANTSKLAGQLTSMAARTPRLAANLGISTVNTGINILNKGMTATPLFSKGVKLIRGLDKVDDAAKATQIANMTAKYRTGLGTVTAMVRSGAYESSLIARSTYDSTLEQSKAYYLEGLVQKWESEGKSQEEINKLLENPDAVIPSYELAKMQKAAENASELAWFSNVPLVGFSNMIQFSKAFSSGYKINKALSSLNPMKITGTVVKDGQRIAKAEAVGRARRIAAYMGTGVKSGVVEGFEEFAQGVMEEGYTDYYSARFSPDAVESSIDFIDAMTKATRNYAGSTEGFDSMSIGFLMGMLGIRLPVKIDAETGKMSLSLKGTGFGGARQEIKDLKKQVEQDKATAKYLNENPVNPILKANFENAMAAITIQKEKDEALEKGDLFNYKNKEYEELHSFVSTRSKLGVEDTIFQDLDALEQLPLDTFNEQFATKGVYEFTEETRKTAVQKTRQNVENILKAKKQTDALFEDRKDAVDFWRKNWKGLQDPLNATEALKDQMTFLYGATLNLKQREAELSAKVKELTNGGINPDVTSKIAVDIAEITEKAKYEFASQAREMVKEQMNEWKENDPDTYHFHHHNVRELLIDLAKIKERKAKHAKMFDVLFTEKGAKQFMGQYEELVEKAHAAMIKEFAEQKKQEMANARSTTTSKKAQADLESIGQTDLAEEALAAEAANATTILDDLKVANGVVDPSQLSLEDVINSLQRNPGLFGEVLRRMDEKNQTLPGIEDIDQMAELLATDPISAARFIETYLDLLNEINANKPVDNIILDYANPEDRNQPLPTDDSPSTISQKYGKSRIQKLKEEGIFQPGSNATDYSIVPILHDKKIENGQLVRDEKTGKFVVMPTEQKVDHKTVNSPTFLPNSELQSKEVYATFKIADNEFNKTNPSVEEITIEVYHGNTFIGYLPSAKPTENNPNPSAQLLALRKAVVNQETAEEVEEITSDIEAQKADIERKVQEVENFVNQEFFANSELLSNHWKTRKDLFENKIKQLKSLLQKGIRTGEDLRTLTNLLNDIRGVLNEGININDNTVVSINEKNIQELANSLFPLISDDVIKEYIEIMNKAMEIRVGSNAVEKMLMGYSDGSGYTLDGKNVEYFLSKETLENIKNNKQINAKYNAELAALEKTSPIREAIDKNFDDIIKALAAAKINVFFNENENTNKKCD